MEILEYMLRSGDTIDEKTVQKLSRGAPREIISDLASLAIKKADIDALLGLAVNHRVAVAEALGDLHAETMKLLGKKAEEGDWRVTRLYYLVRRDLKEVLRPVFRRLACHAVLHSALRITGRGLRGEIQKPVNYRPGLAEFDFEATLERFLEGTGNFLRYDDIVGIERREKRKAGVLMLDSSGSMFGEKITVAALTSAVVAHSMRYDDYAIIVFSDKPRVIRSAGSKGKTDELIDLILDLAPAGYTNISDALEEGLTELERLSGRDKWGVVITDGEYNLGPNPVGVANKFPRLHVIEIPGASPRGSRTCREMAKAGGGHWVRVHSFEEIPRVLMHITKA
ncbi:MAG: hypothetical protein DRO11_03230 [Methanobacteriota archaeon]|nr:MAG: hypothetical protein DRO11_03230 [Euryarchaeota archaeon]